MQQLPLDIRPAAHAVFASFHRGRNALAVESLERLADGAGPTMTWLSGPAGSGKSHLLQATVVHADRRGLAAAYLPLADLHRHPVEVLEGLERFAVLALDDAGAVAGDDHWERALLRLYEALLASGGRLIGADVAPPAQLGFSLRDLSSRFAAGGVLRLAAPDDDERLSALQLRARWRGLELPADTGRYLLARVDRGSDSLFGLLDRLDTASLAAQRPLTVPFVRSVLDAQPPDRKGPL